MLDPLYRSDPYRDTVSTRVAALTAEGGLLTEESLFYPAGGGQPGDAGFVEWEGGRIEIATTVKDAEGRAVLVPAGPVSLPPVGAEVGLRLDWARRYLHMRVHTALHLLSVVIPLPVTGGQIGAGRGRLDFDMPDPPGDVAGLEQTLNALIERDLAVTDLWISDAELAANPGLVKTMSVKPPSGQGRVRLVRIGEGDDQVDLQPCGGTHVARTAEIGAVRIGRIEKKGRANRRVVIALAEDTAAD